MKMKKSFKTGKPVSLRDALLAEMSILKLDNEAGEFASFVADYVIHRLPLVGMTATESETKFTKQDVKWLEVNFKNVTELVNYLTGSVIVSPEDVLEAYLLFKK